jgi:hypothetical protein
MKDSSSIEVFGLGMAGVRVWTGAAEEYPYNWAHPSFRGSLYPVPQRLKPVSLSALPQA